MPEEVVPAYSVLCNQILEPVRGVFPEPFYITSGYRSKEVNQRIGGVANSQHVATGDYAAADFYLESYRSSMQPVFDWIRLSHLLYDQVILEHSKGGDIIHISWAKKWRRQALEGATFNKSAYQARYSVPILTEDT